MFNSRDMKLLLSAGSHYGYDVSVTDRHGKKHQFQLKRDQVYPGAMGYCETQRGIFFRAPGVSAYLEKGMNADILHFLVNQLVSEQNNSGAILREFRLEISMNAFCGKVKLLRKELEKLERFLPKPKTPSHPVHPEQKIGAPEV